MEFEGLIKSHVQRIKTLKNDILTEEATKTSLIMPFSESLDMMYLIQTNLCLSLLLMWVLKRGKR